MDALSTQLTARSTCRARVMVSALRAQARTEYLRLRRVQAQKIWLRV